MEITSGCLDDISSNLAIDQFSSYKFGYERDYLNLKSYERSILSFWLIKINPIVAGITTITAPNKRLQRKFAKEGVIQLNLFLHTP